MGFPAWIRTGSVVLGAALVGLLIGYEVKGSSGKEAPTVAKRSSSVVCTSAIVYIFANGISANCSSDNPPSAAGDSHTQISIVAGNTASITWMNGDTTHVVTGYHILFKESPCDGDDFGPALYNAQVNQNIPCKVSGVNLPPGKLGARSHNYKLLIDGKDPNTKKLFHLYIDPIIIVSGTGQLE